MPNDRKIEDGEIVYWWQDEKFIVRLYTAPGHKEVSIESTTAITIFAISVLKEICEQ